jgi:hypothetical protein
VEAAMDVGNDERFEILFSWWDSDCGRPIEAEFDDYLDDPEDSVRTRRVSRLRPRRRTADPS